MMIHSDVHCTTCTTYLVLRTQVWGVPKENINKQTCMYVCFFSNNVDVFFQQQPFKGKINQKRDDVKVCVKEV